MSKNDRVIITRGGEIAAEIARLLSIAGWHQDRYTWEWVSADNDLCVDLSADNGYVWELLTFTDGDVDGVATPRWKSLGVEGDTVDQLRQTLAQRGYTI